MYLSKIMVRAGGRSDRFRPGHDWIQKPYRVHQRLCMAFPRDDGTSDPCFVKPFDPAHFYDMPEPDAAEKQGKAANVARSADHGFLFRIDFDGHGHPFIIVQSARQPNWDYAFQNAQFLIEKHDCKIYHPTFHKDQRYRFRLLANPTEKTRHSRWRGARESSVERGVIAGVHQDSATGPGDPHLLVANKVPDDRIGAATDGKRRRRACYLDNDPEGTAAVQKAWLVKKSQLCGFSFEEKAVTVEPAGVHRVYRSRDDKEKPILIVAARFDGLLKVTHPARFLETVRQGIGPAKAFGFGLLSLLRNG